MLTLILGITPDTSGLVPAGDFKRLEEFGKEINRLFDNPIGKVNAEGLTAVIKNEKKIPVTHIMLQEDINYGHRIMEFAVEVEMGKSWKIIDSGTAVGHKYIKKLEMPIIANNWRVRVTSSRATPKIINFSLYSNK